MAAQGQSLRREFFYGVASRLLPVDDMYDQFVVVSDEFSNAPRRHRLIIQVPKIFSMERPWTLVAVEEGFCFWRYGLDPQKHKWESEHELERIKQCVPLFQEYMSETMDKPIKSVGKE